MSITCIYCPKVLRNLTQPSQKSQKASVCVFLAKRPRTARCSASAGAYGDTLEHENYDEAYYVYNTARRHIQARR